LTHPSYDEITQIQISALEKAKIEEQAKWQAILDRIAHLESKVEKLERGKK
jgi:hypothetical protein